MKNANIIRLQKDNNIAIENKYAIYSDGNNAKYFTEQDDAIIYAFDERYNHISLLSKPIKDYKIDKNGEPVLPKPQELLQIGNRVGRVYHDFLDFEKNGASVREKQHIWRFVGHGYPCWADTKDELMTKVRLAVETFMIDAEKRGYNTYPYYTRYYR